MRLLLDTHVLLWALMEPERLEPPGRELLEAPGNDVMFSAASIWEVAIKAALDRSDFRVSPAEIAGAAVDSGFAELPVRADAASRVAALPPLHRDPFDRLLVAQAMAEPARLLTTDRQLAAYSELVHVLT